jgi:hypothetical protein
MKRFLLAGTFGAALLVLSAAGLLAQAQTPAAQQTPAASRTPPATIAKPAPAEEGAALEDGVEGETAGSGTPPQSIDFEGGRLTITELEDYGEKVLAYDGKELARDYQVFFEKVVTVGGVNVAMVAVGSGGNQCGAAEVLVWKPEGGEIQSLTIEQDGCGAPPVAVGDNAIYFVPYLLPGETRQALQWAPETGLTTAGLLSYMPEPGTGWADVDPSAYSHIVDAFRNEAVYHAAEKLLGEDLTRMVTSLLVGGGTDRTASGAFYATGCVPHDCGGNDGFMAVDTKKRAVYFARRSDSGRPESWPPMRLWPADIREAFQKAQN